MRKITTLFLALSALLSAGNAMAESTYTTGNASLTASARLDFQITIPKILYLRVGAGSPLATNTTINQITFNLPGASLGNGAPISATAGSGDIGNGTVTARLIGNNGNVSLSASTTGPLSNAAGDTISYSQIATTAATLTSASALPAPVLGDGVVNTTVVPAVSKVVNRDAQWTYTYLNNTIPAVGSYGGVNTNGSRVTYTASMP